MTAAYYYDRNWDKKKQERKRVVVTGIGSVTPIGNTVEDTWSNLIKGTSGIAPITIFDASTFPVKIGAEVKNFDFNAAVPEDLRPFLGRSTSFCIQAAREALREMHRQVGDLQMDAGGIADRGLLVRHLVMPDGLAGTQAVMRFLADELSPDTYVNIMDQYRPCGDIKKFKELQRRITAEELEEALNAARAAGLSRLDNRERPILMHWR